ncbi:MAG: metal ABC transporter substrate-binding protein [Nitrospiraceae bacterium]
MSHSVVYPAYTNQSNRLSGRIRTWAPRLCVAASMLLAATTSFLSAQATYAEEPLSVITTLPVLKDLVQQVGHEHVRVVSLLSGLESEHSYSPKPSDLVALRKAQLLVEIGAGLEVWVSGLVKSAGNPHLHVVTVSRDIPLIEESGSHEAEAHHGHVRGNPHVWLDPDNVAMMVTHIATALGQVDPTHADRYTIYAADYRRTLTATTEELRARLAQFTDRRIVTHHPAWPYFARRFQLEIVADIQAQSGSEPSPRHLRQLIERIRRDKIKVVVSEPQLNQKLARLLADETGARLVVLTPLTGGLPGTETYLDMLRYNVLQLVQAFG